MSDRLKPCPFCGSSHVTVAHQDPEKVQYAGQCVPCEAVGPAAETREKAAELWNRRERAVR